MYGYPGHRYPEPPPDPIQGSYESAISRWMGSQAKMRKGFARAEKPMGELRELFAPGGGYGAGQRAIIEEEAKKARAKAFAGFVSSGMWSGTNVAGTQARIGADVTRAKLGVEDVRTEQLAKALQALASLRATAAGTIGQAGVEPYTGAYIGAKGGIAQAGISGAASVMGAKIRGAAQIQAAQIGANAQQQAPTILEFQA